jgi:luciferase family oxidoreductase group 1
MIPISLLELVRVREGQNIRNALDSAREAAQQAEASGYTRVWVAEHHNIRGVASAATSIVISYLAAATERIRVGAGGIMLPNHPPLVIAEQFGTLATLYPDRIDLGLGRAPGTDQVAARALRLDPTRSNAFPNEVLELQALLAPEQDGQRLIAVPGAGTEVPLWILGSSTFGAQLAAQLGLPYGFASHFAPDALDTALMIYRQRFEPSATLEHPYALVGVNVIAAETDAEARRLFTTQQMSFADLFRGARGHSKPPIDDIDSYWNPFEAAQANRILGVSVVGSVETVRNGLAALIERTRADELMIVSDTYDPAARLKSIALIAEAVRGLVPAGERVPA